MRARLKDKKNAQWELGIWREARSFAFTLITLSQK